MTENPEGMATLHSIAITHSPYKQKFAIPRQPNLVPEAVAELEFLPGYNDPNCLRELDQFSHLWLLFLFHAVADKGWSPTVQPPRLGGKERVGVFASRSPFRPNPIGMSVVKNLGFETVGNKLVLRVGGIDLLHGTPIVDIKPYVPYADSIADASAGFARSLPGHERPVQFSAEAEAQLQNLQSHYPDLPALVASVLRQDPRPAWRVREDDDKHYGMTLYDLNIKWQLQDGAVVVLSVARLQPGTEAL